LRGEAACQRPAAAAADFNAFGLEMMSGQHMGALAGAGAWSWGAVWSRCLFVLAGVLVAEFMFPLGRWCTHCEVVISLFFNKNDHVCLHICMSSTGLIVIFSKKTLPLENAVKALNVGIRSNVRVLTEGDIKKFSVVDWLWWKRWWCSRQAEKQLI
jgi:hypothetical protein